MLRGRTIFGMLAMFGFAWGDASQSQPLMLENPWTPRIHAMSLRPSPGAPRVITQLAFDGGSADTAYDIWGSPDGDFVLTGSTQNPERGDQDLLVMKLLSGGEVRWARTIGGPELDVGFAVRVRGNGDIVVAGWTRSVGAGAGDFYLLGLDANGQTSFERTFGGADEERPTSLTLTRDGSIAVIGESYSHGAGDSRYLLVLADAAGNLIWERTYDGGPLHERGIALLEIADGFLLVGNSMDARSGSVAIRSDGFVVRTDRQGNEVWSRRYGGEAHDIIHHVAPLAGGRFLLTGYSRGFDASGESDLWLTAINADGEIVSTQTSGGAEADHNVIARAAEGGEVLLGGYRRNGTAGWDASLLMLDSTGHAVWDHAYGSSGDDGFVSLYPDSGRQLLALTGYTQRGVGAPHDILFVILDMTESLAR